MSSILYILIAILLFGLLIALHEFGHFAAAKLCGVKVNEFSIGMGPLLLHRQGGETEYSLRLLPIGGFCAMEGEDGDEPSADPRAFPNRPWWQRLVILLAGVAMNFLTGLFLILCFFAPAERFYTPVLSGVMEDARAADYLSAGDRILKVDGHAVYLQSDVSFFLSRTEGRSVDLVVEGPDGARRSVTAPLTAYADEDAGEEKLMLGVYLADTEEATPWVKLRNSWYQAVDYVRLVWISLGDLLTGAVGLREVSGVVGIVSMVGDLGEQGAQAAAEAGTSAILGALENILWFVAFISINLAVMNLLPIPALDGGQILFLAINGLYAAVTRRKLDPKYQGYVTTAGFICLMLLMAAVTVSDILKKFGV